MRRRSWVMSQSRTARPSTATWPSLAIRSPLINLRVVVFPEPLGPSSMRISPLATSRFRSERSTRFPLVRYWTWANWIRGESFIRGALADGPASRPPRSVMPSYFCAGLNSPVQRTRQGCGLRHAVLFRSAPLPDVIEIDGDAERIRRHEAPLSRAYPDHRDNRAVGAGHHPALPFATADHHRG